jgi:hypothetical protein
MKWLFLVIGIVLGAVGMVARLIYVETQRKTDDIVFSLKTYFDSAKFGGGNYVSVSGTLTGDGLGYPNNTHNIACEFEKKECSVTSVEQIGKNQIGRLEDARIYPIAKWNAQEIVAASEVTAPNCTKVTLTIDRGTEALLWVQEPVNHTSPRCKDADTRTYKWTIEDSPEWKRMRAQQASR